MDLTINPSLDLTKTRLRNVPQPLYEHLPKTEYNSEAPAPKINTNYNPISEIFVHTGDQQKLILVMVGLPACGKSFISRKITSYLSWLGVQTQWFNIGYYRRLCAENTVGTTSEGFFDTKNKKATLLREYYALLALIELEKYLAYEGGNVAVLDGTNSTKARRKMIIEFFKRENKPKNLDVKIVFIESICNDERLIERNISQHKVKSPDYADVPEIEAITDFKKRREHYKQRYETVDENDGSFIKIIDTGTKIQGHDVQGYLPARIMYFLMHLNLNKVSHFFTRHGESEYNVQKKIGGDAKLSKKGQNYAKKMSEFISLQPEFKDGALVWCSTLKRCVETAKPFSNQPNTKIFQWRALCEIEAGKCDGMTYNQIKQNFPNEFEERKKNKLSYRYPQGESYKDVIKRLEPVIFELERASKPILVIAHRAVLRCLFGYFSGDKALKDVPYLDVDLHTVYKLTPSDYSTEINEFKFFLHSKNKQKPIINVAEMIKNNAQIKSVDLIIQDPDINENNYDNDISRDNQ